jgi:hypothetical protein
MQYNEAGKYEFGLSSVQHQLLLGSASLLRRRLPQQDNLILCQDIGCCKISAHCNVGETRTSSNFLVLSTIQIWFIYTSAYDKPRAGWSGSQAD